MPYTKHRAEQWQETFREESQTPFTHAFQQVLMMRGDNPIRFY